MAEATTWTASPFVTDIAPITESDDEIRRHLDDADLQPLLPALAYATGDMRLLRDDLRPDPLMIALTGGFTDEQAVAIRELALEVLIRFRDSGCRPAPVPADEDVLRIMEFAVGGGEMADYLPLLEEELAHRGEDRRAPTWRKADVAPERDFQVVVIGAGMSGLLAGHRLAQAGVDFVIVDKNDDVGGTWYENIYPGCRVDNPNHNFSFSFAQRHDWPYHYSTQPVLHRYFRDCADVFGIRDRIRLRTEVSSAVWSDDDARWTVTVRTPDGAEEAIEADAVVSAVGQLNRPNYPDIPGLGSFAGPAFHSARWDRDVDLAGKRVAVIGTGASAMQFVPEIAADVGELLVFQRTPAWMVPTPEYHDAVPAGLTWLYQHVPAYSEFNRFCIFWKMGDGALANVTVDPDWDQPGSVGPMNEMVRLLFTEYLKAEFADRPDLLDAVTPSYPPGAKRMIRDNGIWARTLGRENVRLVTQGICEITPEGVVTADGVTEAVDVIIYGTGFTASEFLVPMTVTGRGGRDLHATWQGEARAYLGVTIPGFPNLFCLYGPNTNIVINGSIIYFSECGVRYILGLIGMLLAGGHRAVDVRPDVHDEFNHAVDAENRRMAWGASDVNTWYKNASGRVSQNWPFTLLEYWRRTLSPDPADYELIS
ncbi:MAG TPA: NAD(P)/FAD-dependent oxidoreductase [Acidimicrobiales bacterium]|nr:NAD(P)/FAD-dependent oxidoreductase [Acidimicrobiales bacterium]